MEFTTLQLLVLMVMGFWGTISSFIAVSNFYEVRIIFLLFFFRQKRTKKPRHELTRSVAEKCSSTNLRCSPDIDIALNDVVEAPLAQTRIRASLVWLRHSIYGARLSFARKFVRRWLVILPKIVSIQILKAKSLPLYPLQRRG
jgi:hypothetical protein